MKASAQIALLVVLLCGLQAAATNVVPVQPARAAALKVTWEPSRLVNGSPIVFEIRTSTPFASITGKWLGRDVFFYRSEADRHWYGVAGVDVQAAPGKYRLQLSAVASSGSPVRFQRMVRVYKGAYRRTALRVAQKYVAPDTDTLLRIERERAMKQQIFRPAASPPEWSGAFVAPVLGAVSLPFGTSRTFNGLLQSIHRGVDYSVPTGTAVVAANSGHVILSRELFYEGNCVVIDHGEGLLTMYLHLSEIQVAEGQSVRRGEKLGLTGATGRVTGPHLHLAASWNGMSVNPAALLNLQMPPVLPPTAAAPMVSGK
jgi:murein DD-endopeptidase MepM/ murein hydrolase activator NlpD